MLWSLPVSMSVICLRIERAAAVEIEQVWQRHLLSSSQVTAWWSGNWTGWGDHCRIS